MRHIIFFLDGNLEIYVIIYTYFIFLAFFIFHTLLRSFIPTVPEAKIPVYPPFIYLALYIYIIFLTAVHAAAVIEIRHCKLRSDI